MVDGLTTKTIIGINELVQHAIAGSQFNIARAKSHATIKGNPHQGIKPFLGGKTWDCEPNLGNP